MDDRAFWNAAREAERNRTLNDDDPLPLRDNYQGATIYRIASIVPPGRDTGGYNVQPLRMSCSP